MREFVRRKGKGEMLQLYLRNTLKVCTQPSHSCQRQSETKNNQLHKQTRPITILKSCSSICKLCPKDFVLVT